MLIPIDRPLIDARNNRSATIQSVDASSFIIQHNNKEVVFVDMNYDRGEITGDGTTPVAPGTKDGHSLTIIIKSRAYPINTITIQDAGNMAMRGSWKRADPETWLKLHWDATASKWIEDGRNDGLGSATGAYAHAEGNSTTAGPAASAHAEGESTTASGIAAHAEGLDTVASGTQSHAEGNGTVVSNAASHAEGLSTTVSGYASHVEGSSSLANGIYAHAQGLLSVASLYAEHAQAAGQFAAAGDAQFSRVIARIATTDATLTETFLDGVDDLLTILNEYTYACKIMVVGRQLGSVDHFMGTYHVLIQRSGGPPALVGAVDIIYENNAGGWGAGGGLPVSILAGATNLEVWVEGLVGHSIRWVVTIEMNRVGY